MMDPAFFVGRKEIVDWVNVTLGLNIAKVRTHTLKTHFSISIHQSMIFNYLILD